MLSGEYDIVANDCIETDRVLVLLLNDAETSPYEDVCFNVGWHDVTPLVDSDQSLELWSFHLPAITEQSKTFISIPGPEALCQDIHLVQIFVVVVQ